MFRLFNEIREAWRRGWEAGSLSEARRIRIPAQETGQERQEGPQSGSASEICRFCGVGRMQRVSNTHARCSNLACDRWVRLSAADADLRPEVEHEFGTVHAGRGADGSVRIIERDWQGNEIGSRPAVKPKDWPLPTPIRS